MSTTTEKWPTQLRLPGQTAAPEGPVDMTMMYVMHHAFRRDLARFAEAARHTPVEDRDAWRQLEWRWEVFAEALHHHHSGEDAGLWPWLLEHGTEEDRETLEAMEAEHAEIDPLLSACAQGLRRLATHADEDTRAALAVRLAATRDHLARHLRHEETGAIPIVQRLMTQEQWTHLEEEHFSKDVSPRRLLVLVPWIADELPTEVIDKLLTEAGLPMRLIWLTTRRRYARRDRAAFRYVDAAPAA